MAAHLLFGGRLSWFLGITPVLVALVAGGLLGIVAGFAGSWGNMAVMRATDVFYAFPSVLLAVAISGALGAGVVNAILSLSLVFIPRSSASPKPSRVPSATSTTSNPPAPEAPAPGSSSASTSCPACSAPFSSTPPASSASP